jgi:hypothetical protein
VIKFRLRCGHAHEFEAWFPSGASYESQAETRQICCPECSSRDVAKAIMAPNVVAGARREKKISLAQTPQRRRIDALREVRRALLAESEDVGRRFPEEARKIHYGEAPPRGIAGTASGKEAQDLLDEGIEILAFPPLPEDAN